MIDIRMEITRKRIEDIKERGPAGGFEIPAERCVPLTPFLKDSPVICEIKRCSPSKKDIDLMLNPLKTATRYRDAGIRNLSVLTEENYFRGSLKDLQDVKALYPDLAVLRKDFLVDVRDIEISYLFGADAVLLITSLLSTEKLKAMYEKAVELGMTPLVEIHDEADAAKATVVKPALVGINSRNLKTFQIDPMTPLRIRTLINWETSVIYESGVLERADGEFVAGTGFEGVLVGEAAVKNPDFPGILLDCFNHRKENEKKYGFWKRLYQGFTYAKPLIKICGITKKDDFDKVVSLGADMAGFILAESPRKTNREFIETCIDDNILKVGVVVLKAGLPLPDEIIKMLEDGVLHAIQFHGEETAEQIGGITGYKAFRLKGMQDIERMSSYPSRAKLIDAFSPAAHGGTGKQIDPSLVNRVSEKGTLWLAGGLNPENIKGILNRFKPELIDISSGVELSPGVKDHTKLDQLFEKAAFYE
ncbi:MAG: bifunctional indole-3-glycerol phosphate synthase/phosphoribosylanthranilate isomerase [Spirochaetales bacterium]|nr:bifunctional indole-3-glycerol phosphate synthase/phosphoribosylanthranilate isomerase [Spirochaetales bacterium]